MQEIYKEARVLSEKIYNLSSILQQYCQVNSEIEAVAHINTLVEYLYNNVDRLNGLFIEAELS